MARTMVAAIDDEASERSGTRFVRMTARSFEAVAQTLPVSEFFFTQLGPGRFEIDSTTAFVDDALVTRTRVGPLVAGTVVANPAVVAFLLPLRWEGQYLFNGVRLTASSLCIAGGGSGYHTRGARRESMTIGLARSRLTATIAALRGVDPDDIRLDDRVLTLPWSVADRLRERLTAIVALCGEAQTWSDSEPGRRDTKSEVYQLLLDAYLDAQAVTESEPRRVLRRSEIVRRAEDCFIGAGGKPLSLADLCAAAGVGRTALQRAFHDLYGESPLSYFHKRRLTQAREALVLAPATRAAVKRAALGAGLTALGRFSVEYRLLFGECPSATLTERSA